MVIHGFLFHFFPLPFLSFCPLVPPLTNFTPWLTYLVPKLFSHYNFFSVPRSLFFISTLKVFTKLPSDSATREGHRIPICFSLIHLVNTKEIASFHSPENKAAS